MINLRDYQTKIVADCRQAFREGDRKVVVQLATGGGKTVLGSFMVHGAAQQRALTCWWLVHRRELISQASKTFYDMGIPHGIIAGGHASDPLARVQVGSIQTIARRLDKMPPPDMIVFDETHHIGAAQWSEIFARFPQAYVLGLTATPWRLDGRGLGQWYARMVQGPTVAELIERGSLSPYRLFAPSAPDMRAVQTQAGDYKQRALAEIMDKPSITGDAVQHYRQLCPGKRAVAFAVSIEHSRHIAAEFNAAGIRAEHVDGTMDIAARDAAVARFVAGDTLILSNAELFGEGFDVPAIEAAILLRPTKSLSLYLQQVGRALRPAPGKAQAVILDHAGNSLTHGLPDDEREWTLDDREKQRRAAESAAPVRQCAKCFRVYRPAPKCPGCGFAAPVAVREIEKRDGELVEVDASAVKEHRKAEERACKSLADWQRLGAARGYKPGWALKQFQIREQYRSRRKAA
ncbi:DEAD/DEAH box helicase [Sphingomonas sp.]|uniref:DEAD/DEAH box helicase n=1 Tax=Sphingomonas sp. TaxID=28214 RepID=UPI003F715A87